MVHSFVTRNGVHSAKASAPATLYTAPSKRTRSSGRAPRHRSQPGTPNPLPNESTAAAAAAPATGRGALCPHIRRLRRAQATCSPHVGTRGTHAWPPKRGGASASVPLLCSETAPQDHSARHRVDMARQGSSNLCKGNGEARPERNKSEHMLRISTDCGLPAAWLCAAHMYQAPFQTCTSPAVLACWRMAGSTPSRTVRVICRANPDTPCTQNLGSCRPSPPLSAFPLDPSAPAMSSKSKYSWFSLSSPSKMTSVSLMRMCSGSSPYCGGVEGIQVSFGSFGPRHDWGSRHTHTAADRAYS